MVQRFSIMHESFFNPDDKGQFVSYHDYAAIERERDELLQKVQVLEKENALLRACAPILRAKVKERSRTFPGIARAMAEQWG